MGALRDLGKFLDTLGDVADAVDDHAGDLRDIAKGLRTTAKGAKVVARIVTDRIDAADAALRAQAGHREQFDAPHATVKVTAAQKTPKRRKGSEVARAPVAAKVTTATVGTPDPKAWLQHVPRLGSGSTGHNGGR